MNPAILVLGSLNMDFVVTVEHLPAPGETVLGRDFQMIPGGKGANQACAAGKLSRNHPVKMAGRVGYDLFADHLKASLAAAGVDVSAVIATRSQPTGVAFIWVDQLGQNSIVVASGANHAILPPDIDGLKAAFAGNGFVLFQLETPLTTVEAAMDAARRQGSKTILDPAPAQPLRPELLAKVDILTPNETEASMLLGRKATRISVEEAPELARAVLKLGSASVVLKLGDQGSFFTDGQTEILAPAFPVEARDTTAAGDTFNAGLAIGLSEGMDMASALRFANAAAALSVTRLGAQASIPSRAEVDGLLAASH